MWKSQIGTANALQSKADDDWDTDPDFLVFFSHLNSLSTKLGQLSWFLSCKLAELG
jgi:hypothetical protein